MTLKDRARFQIYPSIGGDIPPPRDDTVRPKNEFLSMRLVQFNQGHMIARHRPRPRSDAGAVEFADHGAT